VAVGFKTTDRALRNPDQSRELLLSQAPGPAGRAQAVALRHDKNYSIYAIDTYPRFWVEKGTFGPTGRRCRVLVKVSTAFGGAPCSSFTGRLDHSVHPPEDDPECGDRTSARPIGRQTGWRTGLGHYRAARGNALRNGSRRHAPAGTRFPVSEGSGLGRFADAR